MSGDVCEGVCEGVCTTSLRPIGGDLHDAMMHWRGKNKNGENWILFFVFFFFSFVLCVCVEREKRINEEHGLFFVSNQI